MNHSRLILKVTGKRTEKVMDQLRFDLDTRCSTIHILPMDKDEVAEILVNIATLLELKGENPFKSRAYLNAARALEGMIDPLDKVIAEERLDQVEGIGESTRKKICELVMTGKLAAIASSTTFPEVSRRLVNTKMLCCSISFLISVLGTAPSGVTSFSSPSE